MLAELDGVSHARGRRVVLAALRRRVVDELRAPVRHRCRDLLDRGLSGERLDLVGEVAAPALQAAISELFALEPDQEQEFLALASGTGADLFPTETGDESALVRRLDEHMGNLIRARRAAAAAPRDGEPRDAVRAMMLAAESESPPVPDAELAVHMRSLAMAAYGGTVDLLANLLHRLLVEPGLWVRVAADRVEIARVMEECLRYEAPAALLNRRCAVSTTVGDQDVAEGDILVVAVGMANRDPAHHVDPDRFDVDRPQATNHVSFGVGPHACAGIPLVRLLVAELVGELLDRMPLPPPLLDSTDLGHAEFFVSRGPKSLVVALDAPVR